MTSSSTFFLNLSFSLLSPLTTQKIINARIRKLIIAERKLPIFIDVPGIIHLDISITDSTALVSPTVLVAAVLSAPVIRDTTYAIPGLIMSATSESTMLLNAPPTTTPTAISTTFPRDIKSLNSSTNFIAIYPHQQHY